MKASLQSICLTTQKYKNVLEIRELDELMAGKCMNFFKIKKAKLLNYFAFLLSESTILVGVGKTKESWWTDFEDSYLKIDTQGGEKDKNLKDFSLNCFNSFQTRIVFLFKSEEKSAYGINMVRLKSYNESHLESKTKVSKEETITVDHSLDLAKIKALNEQNEYTHIFVDDATHSLIILGLMLETTQLGSGSRPTGEQLSEPQNNEFIRFQICNIRESDYKFEANVNKRDIASNLQDWLNSNEVLDTTRFAEQRSDPDYTTNDRFIPLLHPKLNSCELSFETDLHYFYGLLILRTNTNSIWLLLVYRSKQKKNNEFMKHRLIECRVKPQDLNKQPTVTVESIDNECVVKEIKYTDATDYTVQISLSLSDKSVASFEIKDILDSIKYNQK